MAVDNGGQFPLVAVIGQAIGERISSKFPLFGRVEVYLR